MSASARSYGTMGVALVTGAAGLVGSASVRRFAARGLEVVGLDNNMRRTFFGDHGNIEDNLRQLRLSVPSYTHIDADIRDRATLVSIFRRLRRRIAVIVHAAGQPSHDWSARDPSTDFHVNAVGTLNLLTLAQEFAPEAVFIFTSTNKVYGDTPNQLPLEEHATRWEPSSSHMYAEHGVDEAMTLDQSLHTPFGISKVSADLLVQEFGRYYGLRTVTFRAGCITGSGHAAAELHGFLAYLCKCIIERAPYTIYGYKGKQVRDLIHADDLAAAFECVVSNPVRGEVYNIGGGRRVNCSIVEALDLLTELSGTKLACGYSEKARRGDHQWWISDARKFQRAYPEWCLTYDTNSIVSEVYDGLRERLS
jgi:CDP-paratose 2-epimerase